MSNPKADRSGLQPEVVSIPTAMRLLGEKSRSEVYDAIGRGDLDARKDGHKTLITTRSIRRYVQNLPVAVLGHRQHAA